MDALVDFFKKHKALAWIGIGVLAIGAYIIGKNIAGQTQQPSAQTPLDSVGTVNYNYIQAQPAAQPLASDTTATTPATPAATPIPQLTSIITATHPAGIVDVPYLSSPQYQYAQTGQLLPTVGSPITLPALPPNGSFTNIGGGQYQVVGGNTGYSIGQILHIIPPSNKGAAVYGQTRI